MSDSRVDFAGCSPVNHLWPQFVERLGSDRAQRAVRQALDVQSIHGNSSTLPVLVVETCGSALASTDLIREQIGLNAHGERMVLLLSTREKLVQLLQQAV
ncbi:hypothetical protein [Synechococcus sp. MIT S1220]|uniref:hypothetical protein n=1 Tax=Synechococcus sp. MIT S1220 TaxID=3082549 RepID=UPI0039AF21E7